MASCDNVQLGISVIKYTDPAAATDLATLQTQFDGATLLEGVKDGAELELSGELYKVENDEIAFACDAATGKLAATLTFAMTNNAYEALKLELDSMMKYQATGDYFEPEDPGTLLKSKMKKYIVQRKGETDLSNALVLEYALNQPKKMKTYKYNGEQMVQLALEVYAGTNGSIKIFADNGVS